MPRSWLLPGTMCACSSVRLRRAKTMPDFQSSRLFFSCFSWAPYFDASIAYPRGLNCCQEWTSTRARRVAVECQKPSPSKPRAEPHLRRGSKSLRPIEVAETRLLCRAFWAFAMPLRPPEARPIAARIETAVPSDCSKSGQRVQIFRSAGASLRAGKLGRSKSRSRSPSRRQTWQQTGWKPRPDRPPVV